MVLFLSLLARAGHGKTTASKFFERAYGAKTISLAGPLKRAAKKVMGFTDEQLYGTQAQKEAIDPRFGFSARQFLQLLGTDGLRDEFDKDIHLDTLVKLTARDQHPRQAFGDAEIQRRENQIYIVDDCRFPNEVAYFNRIAGHPLARLFCWAGVGGATIKIVCTDAPAPVGSMATHASETSIDLVPESELAATVISSRAQGHDHLIGEIEKAIMSSPRLADFRSPKVTT